MSTKYIFNNRIPFFVSLLYSKHFPDMSRVFILYTNTGSMTKYTKKEPHKVSGKLKFLLSRTSLHRRFTIPLGVAVRHADFTLHEFLEHSAPCSCTSPRVNGRWSVDTSGRPVIPAWGAWATVNSEKDSEFTLRCRHFSSDFCEKAVLVKI